MTLLCVEDDETALSVIANYLVRQGAKVLTARNGRQGLDLFLQHRPQMVISDINMPEMDGIAMCRAIREADQDVIIIIMSAYNEPEMLLKSIDFGVTKYLLKPVKLAELKSQAMSSALLLRTKDALEAKLSEMSDIVSNAEYEGEKLQSYIVRYMGTDHVDEAAGVRNIYVPKGEVSGDFFCIEHFDDTIYAIVADGSGHGLSAILPALQAPRIFRSQAKLGYSLSSIADSINRALHEQNLAEHFMAATLVRMNYREGFIEVLNCGNPSAVLVSEAGEVLQEFNSHELALGILDADSFDVDIRRYECKQKARIYLSTDGLADSLNAANGGTFELAHFFDATNASFDDLVKIIDELPAQKRVDDITLLKIQFQPSSVADDVSSPETVMQMQPGLAVLDDIDSTLSKINVLLVEDNPETLEYLSRYLGRRVGQLHHAHDGAEGLRIFKEYRPQLVIADIKMPHMDGIAMVEAIRKIDPDVPIIIISGSLEQSNVEDMLNLKVSKFLQKPIEIDKLKDAINECMRQFDSIFGIKLSASVFMTSPLAISITGKNREILAVNPAFCQITGYTQAEVIGHNPKILSSGKHDETFYRTMWDGINTKGSWSGEIWNRRKSGEIFLEWITINEVRRDDNEIAHYVAIFSDITERNAAEAKIRHLAQHDSLTNLPNRILFMDRVRQALLHAQREKEILAIMFLDIDHFKTINDTLGHSAGDELLCTVARDLTCSVRDTDTVSRMGGDEFAILLPEAGSREMISRIAGKISAATNRTRPIAGQELQVGISIGISVYPNDGADAESLIKHADSAMYHSKRSGRNHHRFFESGQDGTEKRLLAIQQGMRSGLYNDEFSMVYQPKYSLSKKAVVGAEALLRWNSSSLGNVSPAEFIPIAEETGFIVDIGAWVINAVSVQIAAWNKFNMRPGPVAINISPLHFHRGNVLSSLLHAIEINKLSSAAIKIELTEGIVMKDSEATLGNLLELKSHGFDISIDDFGTGYSSLNYLRRLPIDELKIDRSFIMEIGNEVKPADKSVTAIPMAIIQLAKSLGLSLVAEGVETETQKAFLEENGCDQFQGYLFCKPLPPDEFATFVTRFSE